VLQGKGPEDLKELCLELAGWMLHLGGAAPTVAEGKQQGAKLISTGQALEKFRQMIELQGGDARVIDDAKRLPQAQHTVQIAATKSGYIASVQCEQIGTACVILGGGRERKEDSVDPSVGIVLHGKVGDRVADGEPLATIHYNSAAKAARAQQLIESSCEIAETAPAKRPLVHRIIGKQVQVHGLKQAMHE
jgi:thymidine phosphorylase